MSRAYGFLLEFIPMKIGAGMTFLKVALNMELRKVEPHGQSPWHLTNAQAGRHPGQKLAHSSSRQMPGGFLLPGQINLS